MKSYGHADAGMELARQDYSLGRRCKRKRDERAAAPRTQLHISSRREMRALQERLARRYSTLAVDWPGFGEATRPQVDWTPEAYIRVPGVFTR